MGTVEGENNVKYDVQLNEGLDLYHENSLTLILKQIQPRTKVLEFGPAFGRMTRVLKEKKCEVYCVEMNKEAVEIVSQIADKVIQGDIEQGKWLDEWREEKFDYIIFADVLEHLKDPVSVLENASNLLRENGQVYFSVPNIAHDAVLEGLYNNQFEYQNMGILDKTHLKFFTYFSVEEMCYKCKLKPIYKAATHYTIDMTGINTGSRKVEWIRNSNRPFGDVYQFIYGVKKEDGILLESIYEDNHCECIENQSPFFLQVFFDKGEGYNEDDSTKFWFPNELSLNLKIRVPESDRVRKIRIDPINTQCILSLNTLQMIMENGENKKIEEVCSNADSIYRNIYFFSTMDPQMDLGNIQNLTKEIEISLDIIKSDFKIDTWWKDQLAYSDHCLEKEVKENESLSEQLRLYQKKTKELEETKEKQERELKKDRRIILKQIQKDDEYLKNQIYCKCNR